MEPWSSLYIKFMLVFYYVFDITDVDTILYVSKFCELQCSGSPLNPNPFLYRNLIFLLKHLKFQSTCTLPYDLVTWLFACGYKPMKLIHNNLHIDYARQKKASGEDVFWDIFGNNFKNESSLIGKYRTYFLHCYRPSTWTKDSSEISELQVKGPVFA